MDTARYVVAVITWAGFPPAVVYWFMIHPFAERWRGVGVRTTMVVVFSIFVALAAFLVFVRDYVLVTEFGTHWTLWVAAGVSYIIALGIERLCRKHLKFRTLTGVPELSVDQSARELLNEG